MPVDFQADYAPSALRLSGMPRSAKGLRSARACDLATANLPGRLVDLQAQLRHFTRLLRDEAARRRQLEMAFHESEERFITFMDNSPIMAFIKNSRGRYLYGNRLWKSFFQGSTPELDARGPSHGPSRAEIRAEDRVILQSGRCVEAVRCWRDGQGRERWWLSLKFPLLDPRGRAFVGGVALDITERLRQEREILEISEREQQRIGQDLHDELCQYLAAIKFKNSLLERKLSANGRAESAEAREVETMLNVAIDRAHRLARGLHPVNFEGGGLARALAELAENFTSVYHCPCTCSIPRPVSLPDDGAAIHLYRIAQEGMTNALKHGLPKSILLTLQQFPGRIVLTVADDGHGLPERADHRNGMGLHLMRYRARMIGATLTLANQPRGGALLTCVLPLPAAAPARKRMTP